MFRVYNALVSMDASTIVNCKNSTLYTVVQPMPLDHRTFTVCASIITLALNSSAVAQTFVKECSDPTVQEMREIYKEASISGNSKVPVLFVNISFIPM